MDLVSSQDPSNVNQMRVYQDLIGRFSSWRATVGKLVTRLGVTIYRILYKLD